MRQASKELAQKCPLCGKNGILKPHPEKPGRFALHCECNPNGPVVETDAPQAQQHQEDEL